MKNYSLANLPKKSRDNLEHNFQILIIQALRLNKFFCFAIPNGGSRNKLEAINLKKEGVLAGVSDIVVVLKNKTIYIELKQGKNKQQDTQKKFQEEVEDRGHKYLLINEYKQILDFIEEYKEEK